METKTARRKAFDVEYVVVNEDNIEEIVSWCGGALGGEDADRFVRIIDKNAVNQRQTKAFIGDYMLKLGSSFKSFSKKAFDKSFDEVVASGEKVVEHARSAKTGKFVSKKTAEENPDTTVVETSEIPTEDLRGL